MLAAGVIRWAHETPDAVALRMGDRTVSYAALSSMAQRVARELENQGIVEGDRVAFQLGKTPETIAVLLGILLAKAAYVPIDSRAPAERVAKILLDCTPRALVISPALLDKLEAARPDVVALVPRHYCLQGEHPKAHLLDTSAGSGVCASGAANPESPAYILYTSGTTGKPKGVELCHRAACAFVDWAIQAFSLNAYYRFVNIAPLSFDLSIFDLFAAFAVGAQVALVGPEMLLFPRELVDRLVQWETNIIYSVPSTLQLLTASDQANGLRLSKLQRVLYAGEPFPIPGLIKAMRALPQAQFYNLFGPTETNVHCFYCVDHIPDETDTAVPIGNACAHLEVELRDDTGQLVKTGEPGELCVAGPALMTGYFGDRDGTARTFWSEARSGDCRQFYRTGDYARRDERGRYWFLGRRDRMVKRRGYRVELGEIDSVLLKHSAVSEAATYAERVGEETRVHAVVALKSGCSVSPLMLKAHTGTLLPPYLVPDTVSITDLFPRTLTGKVDLQALANLRL